MISEEDLRKRDEQLKGNLGRNPIVRNQVTLPYLERALKPVTEYLESNSIVSRCDYKIGFVYAELTVERIYRLAKEPFVMFITDKIKT